MGDVRASGGRLPCMSNASTINLLLLQSFDALPAARTAINVVFDLSSDLFHRTHFDWQ